jgi:hypothetical protein
MHLYSEKQRKSTAKSELRLVLWDKAMNIRLFAIGVKELSYGSGNDFLHKLSV